MYKIIKFS